MNNIGLGSGVVLDQQLDADIFFIVFFFFFFRKEFMTVYIMDNLWMDFHEIMRTWHKVQLIALGGVGLGVGGVGWTVSCLARLFHTLWTGYHGGLWSRMLLVWFLIASG